MLNSVLMFKENSWGSFEEHNSMDIPVSIAQDDFCFSLVEVKHLICSKLVISTYLDRERCSYLKDVEQQNIIADY